MNLAPRSQLVLVGALQLLRNPSVARVAFATLILAAFALGADVLAMMLQGGSETPLAYRIAAAVGSFVVLLAIAGLTVGSLFWLRKGATREEFGGGSAV